MVVKTELFIGTRFIDGKIDDDELRALSQIQILECLWTAQGYFHDKRANEKKGS